MLQAPRAVGYWLGLGQRGAVEDGDDVIFLCHGTPRRMAARLERQLRYLRRVFTIVPLAAFAASIGAPRTPGRRRRAAITFDDGLRSNVHVAYPILRALGIPATFFVCPGLIEERRWLWTHESRRRLQFAGPHLREELAVELGAPAEVEAFVQWMKTIDFPQRTRVEASLKQATAAFTASEQDREAFDLADWDELRSLDPSIVTVGSHTMTHPVLPSMSTPQIEAELRDSRRMIEAKLARPAEFFSYPNDNFDERTLSAVRRYYRAAVCCNSAPRSDPHLMPSAHLPRGVLALALQVNRQRESPAEAVVCVGDTGINGLASVRSLGRRGVRVHVVALQASAQIASLSRYCAKETRVSDLGALYDALRALPLNPARPALLFIDNDKMMKALAPHAAELQRRFRVVEPLAHATRFMDKVLQLQAAAEAGIAVPRTWLPNTWEDIAAIAAQTSERLLAKPSPVRFAVGVNPSFKAIVAASALELERQLRLLVGSAADVLVQEYIDGDDSCHYGSLCYRARSNACFVVSTRKVRQTTLEAGIVAVGRLVDEPEVRRMTVRLVEALDYRGVIHVEFKRSPRDGKYYFIEWNARPPYFHSIGWKAAFDGAYFAYCDHIAPEKLDAVRLRHDSGHYWINVHEDLRRLAKSPRLALRPSTWLPYLQAKEWAVFALDDPKPWLRSMQHLAAWLWQLLGRAARKGMRRSTAALGARGA